MEVADHQYSSVQKQWGAGVREQRCPARKVGMQGAIGAGTQGWTGVFLHLGAAFVASKVRHLCYQMAFTSPPLPALSLSAFITGSRDNPYPELEIRSGRQRSGHLKPACFSGAFCLIATQLPPIAAWGSTALSGSSKAAGPCVTSLCFLSTCEG